MLEKMTRAAALAGALSLAAVPFLSSVASAQEPPTAPNPSDSASKSGSMSKDSMSKSGTMSKSSSKKSKKHMQKKPKDM